MHHLALTESQVKPCSHYKQHSLIAHTVCNYNGVCYRTWIKFFFSPLLCFFERGSTGNKASPPQSGWPLSQGGSEILDLIWKTPALYIFRSDPCARYMYYYSIRRTDAFFGSGGAGCPRKKKGHGTLLEKRISASQGPATRVNHVVCVDRRTDRVSAVAVPCNSWRFRDAEEAENVHIVTGSLRLEMRLNNISAQESGTKYHHDVFPFFFCMFKRRRVRLLGQVVSLYTSLTSLRWSQIEGGCGCSATSNVWLL